ncbi:hypothetical protein DZA51_03990 [Vibrio campbellii]|nr:hypothetical protein DZA51_03990 [Vibrio campbellii]
MKFKNYLGSSNLSLINDFDKQKTKNIVDKGLISDLNSKGFPYFTPIGSVILTNIESIFSSFFSYGDYQSIRLPTAMKTSSLHKGQPLGEQFKSKIMHLTGSLDDHHIMSSPETLFIELGQKEQISHSQLPIKLSYIENLHRQKSNATGTLYPQQISIFGGVSIGNYEVLTKGFVEIDQLISSCLKIIGLPFHKEEKHNSFEAEFFYICDSSREGELMQLPGYSRDKVSAYSLGMYYDYPMQDDFRIRFRNKYNRNQKPYLLSFGLSPSRILHCIFCEYSDDHGYALPSSVRPFELVIIPESKKDLEKAQSIYSKIRYKLLKMSSNVSANCRWVTSIS